MAEQNRQEELRLVGLVSVPRGMYPVLVMFACGQRVDLY